jgi:FAD/FMN-containing dehydrogenase
MACAEAGLTLGEFVRATQTWGLATTTGTVAGTGLAGLTLGGGLGWLMGAYGLTIDNLCSVQLVTAEGRILRASITEEAELFWGVRGGGGNFGIVTAFEFQLHPVGPVLAGKVIYPLAQARSVLRCYREYTSSLPDELTAYASLLTTSDGVPAIAITLCYCGSLEEGERLVKPVRTFGTPIADFIRPMSYLKLLTRADAGAPRGRSYYEKARMLKHLNDEAVEAFVECGARCTSPFSCVLIQHVHGAASRIDPSQTAFALREEGFVISIVAAWDDGAADQHIAWTDKCWLALEPYSSSGVYVNFLGDEEEGQVRAAYGANHERLVTLKNRYDPTNCFALNQNITPTITERKNLA